MQDWVKDQHGAKAFFPLLVFYKMLLYSFTACAVALKLGEIYHLADVRNVSLVPYLAGQMHFRGKDRL